MKPCYFSYTRIKLSSSCFFFRMGGSVALLKGEISRVSRKKGAGWGDVAQSTSRVMVTSTCLFAGGCAPLWPSYAMRAGTMGADAICAGSVRAGETETIGSQPCSALLRPLSLMMNEDEDMAARDDLDVTVVPRVSDGEEETESDALSSRKTEREKESEASAWGEMSSDDGASRVIADKQTQQIRVTAEPGVEARFHAFSADDNDGDDDAGNYQIVKKSIYKPHRKGFLSRLTGGAPVASTKKKYAYSDITGIITGEEAAPKVCETNENNAVDLTIEEEEAIQVAIERSQTPRGAGVVGRAQQHLSAEDAALGGPTEVVIHSGDSEPGFATLNPIIGSNVQRSAPTHGAFVAPAMTKSSGVPAAKASPVLLEIPAAEQQGQGRDRLLLIINALGATGLSKVEKFGTQSCLLEMSLFDSTDAGNVGAGSSYLIRTELHKKGGSEAQWNQQFTTTLRSKETQILHVEVKTSSKILVGEANVPLDKVGDLFYDQHYPLSRSDDSSDIGNEPVLLSAGQVHLQLKIVDTVTMATPTAVIPHLQLPLFTNWDNVQPKVKSPLSAKSIPAVLLNGSLFFKIPYHTHNLVGYASGPRRQWVAVRRAADPPHLQITWGDPTLSGSSERKSVRSLDLALVTEIREGHTSEAFKAQTESNVVRENAKCFSLVTRSRTLDLVAASKEEARIWVSSLRELLFSSESSANASLMSARTIESYKQSALSPRDQDESSNVKPAAAPAPTKRMIAVWRNRVFNLARHDRIDDILESLEDGCPIDLLESGSGDTLLMLACRLGNAELVELCLSRRAKNDPHPEFGETALQVAVNSSHAHCVGLLLSTAAKSDMDSEIVNHIDPSNDAPLHVAARHGDLACLQLLLHHGADICVVEEFGRTPLHCAVANGNLDCVAYLLDVGGDSVLNSGDHDGDTALHYAALSGNEAIVKLLLESAANVFATNVHKETAYDIAVREKQQRCAELIAKYFITNEKEISIPSVTRNEPASTLLGRQRRELASVVLRDSAALIEAAFEEDPPSTAFVDPEVWKPGLDGRAVDYEDDYESYLVKHRSAGLAATSSATSRLPLSPSEQVRDALTKNHRANSLSPRPPNPVSPFYSSRELRSYSPYPSSSERLVATERFDRERIRPFQLYREDDPRFLPRQSWEYYHPESGYPPYGSQTQRQAPPEYAQPLQTYYMEARIARNVEMNTASRTAPWGQYNDFSTNAYSHQASHFPRTESQWDTLYTEDGYPYYVNRTTGVSQWEKPVEDSVGGDYRTQPKPDASADSLSPDAIIRLRLAEVRKQKSQTALVSPASSMATSCSTPTLAVQPATTGLVAQQSSERPAEPNQVQISKSTQEQQTPVSSEPSKYEARTGFKLAVDISAPPAQDASRPSLSPSPLSKSPIKKLLEGADEDGPSGSFEKSRASSPRGRSKNIQFIELKRANNLALALASFKIHDHYEQIVNDIVAMDERVVNPALLGCLQRFFPTEKEKQALQSFTGSVSTLGKAERFFCFLFQVPGMQERIDMFLYKMEFARTHSSLLSRVLVVKRACRDLVENYSFVQALEQFFKKQKETSFSMFEENKAAFISGYLPELDEKLRSFRADLAKAKSVELVELQLQLNRLMAGIRPIQSFVNRSPTSKAGQSEERDGKARDILQRFLAESRGPLTEIESEYEAMELWGDKLLAVFGESKATCAISAILHAVVEML